MPRRRRAGPGHLTLIVVAAMAVVLLRAGCRARGPIRHGPLATLTVVLDPGHGGSDPGASHGGLVESTLTYRMAALLKTRLEADGARVVLTVRSRALEIAPTGRNEPPLSPADDARFALDGTPVAVEGIYRRADLARRVWDERPRGERVVFLALHFDARPGTRSRGGLVCYDRRAGAPPELAGRLAAALIAHKRAGDEGARLSSRELAVLNPERNPIPDKALVELATLTSAADRAAVRRPAWRAGAVAMLVEALRSPERAASAARK